MPRTVLIVDDEADIRAYLSAVLESNGYEVHAVGGVKDGLSAARRVRPHLICLDIMMPGESGISFYLKLMEDDDLRHIPIFVISGMEHEQEFDFSKFVPDVNVPPPARYIEKPINVANFVKDVCEEIGPGNLSENASPEIESNA